MSRTEYTEILYM